MKKKTKKVLTKIFLIIATVALVGAVFVPPIYYIVNGIKNKKAQAAANITVEEEYK